MDKESVSPSKGGRQLASVTWIALDHFEKLCRAERRARREEAKLAKYAALIPKEDVDYYIRVTDEIAKRFEEVTEVKQ